MTTSPTALDKEYNKDFTDIIEFVYGDEMLSQGGTDSIDLLLQDIDLNNKTLLEIGTGLGGVVNYLAQKYTTDITAIDRVERLINTAQQRQMTTNLLGKIQFLHTPEENSLTRFDDNSFNIILIKEVLLHIKDKSHIINDCMRVLRPGGCLIILDWITPDGTLGPNITKMMELDNLELYLDSKATYRNHMQKAGLIDIQIQNYAKQYISYTQDNIAHLTTHQKEFISKFDKESLEASIESWQMQKKAFETGEVIVSRITAKKAK